MYKSNSSLKDWTIVKHIVKYLWRTKDYMFECLCNMDSDFHFDKDRIISTSRYVYILSDICYYFQSNKGSRLVKKFFI